MKTARTSGHFHGHGPKSLTLQRINEESSEQKLDSDPGMPMYIRHSPKSASGVHGQSAESADRGGLFSLASSALPTDNASSMKFAIASFLSVIIISVKFFFPDKIRSLPNFDLSVPVYYRSTISSKTAMSLRRNGFIADFTRALQPMNTTYLSTNWPPPDGIFYIPFILRNGRLQCPPNLEEIQSIDQSTRGRSGYLIDMMRTALDSRWQTTGGVRHQTLPFLAFIADQNGCDVSERSNAFAYPRFSWSVPATKFGVDWCNAFSLPAYSNWASFRNENETCWDSKLASNWRKYPWSSKKNKAVWRGSTTYPPSFMGAKLNETPRGKLVQMGMKNPDLIDSAFVNFVQFFKDKKDELRNQTNVAIKRMPFEKQMTYRAIIDIDGNNWSSRFASLLCTNSVVIKVRALSLTLIFFLPSSLVSHKQALFRCRSTQIILSTFTTS